MLTWWQRLFRKPRPILIVMRLADMVVEHPNQITRRCERCHHEVAVYPSGQRAMREHPGIELVCSHCETPGPQARLAPGARIEPFQSHRKQ